MTQRGTYTRTVHYTRKMRELVDRGEQLERDYEEGRLQSIAQCVRRGKTETDGIVQWERSFAAGEIFASARWAYERARTYASLLLAEAHIQEVMRQRRRVQEAQNQANSGQATSGQAVE